MSTSQETPGVSTPATPVPPLPPERISGPSQKPGLCCILPGLVLFLIFVGLTTSLVLYLYSLYSVDDRMLAARTAADRNRSAWIDSKDAKALFSLTGKSSFVSDPDAGLFMASYSSSDAGNFIELVPVEAGSFVMGSDSLPDVNLLAMSDGRVEMNTVLVSGPARRVTLSRDFLMGRTEVMVGQFRIFVEATGHVTDAEKAGRSATWRDSGSSYDDLPVTNVSWNDAAAYSAWLTANDRSLPEGWEYRLPTEAEWEYACRAGSAAAYAFGDNLTAEQANVRERSDAWAKRVLPAGAYPANAWSLADMHGSVAEWCLDWYDRDFYSTGPERDPAGPDTGAYRALRGGSWNEDADKAASARRNCLPPDASNPETGFRIVLAPK